jgi:hypothetical protein
VVADGDPAAGDPFGAVVADVVKRDAGDPASRRHGLFISAYLYEPVIMMFGY